MGEALAAGILGDGEEIQVVGGGAPTRGEALVIVVSLAALAVVDVEIEAFGISLRDDVDDAGDGVRAIDGGGAALQDLHSLDGIDGNEVDIGGVLGLEAPAVQEYQGVLRADAAQVQGGGADGGAVRAALAAGVAVAGLSGQDEIGLGLKEVLQARGA